MDFKEFEVVDNKTMKVLKITQFVFVE